MGGEFDVMFKTIAELVSRKRDRDLREYDLTFSQLRVLLAAMEEEEGVAQKELERTLGISHAAVHALLGRLEEKGMIRVLSDATDRRRNVILVTDLARNKVRCLQRQYASTPPSSILTEEDRKDLSRVLGKIISSLQEEERAYRERLKSAPADQ